jgi:hypothetical protein
MAADRSDASALRQHRDALPAGEIGSEFADRLELDGRLAAIEGKFEEALHQLDRAALLRSRDGDYRGMARVLVVAGTAVERAGRPELAGGYFLRAGRSGARRGDPDARGWLERALALGERTGDAAMVLEARTMLGELAAERPRNVNSLKRLE